MLNALLLKLERKDCLRKTRITHNRLKSTKFNKKENAYIMKRKRPSGIMDLNGTRTSIGLTIYIDHLIREQDIIGEMKNSESFLFQQTRKMLRYHMNMTTSTR